MVPYTKDRVEIETPEGVAVELELANVGSRAVATMVDHAIQAAIVLAAVLAFSLAGSGGLLAIGLVSVIVFLVVFAYPIAWEVWGGGRTPGKRWSNLRVVRADGSAVRFVDSAIRNLIRLLEGFATSYVLASISVFVSARNQRLGDLAAGTIVVREPRAPAFRPATSPPGFVPDAPRWDVSGVGLAEVAAIRRFLERRTEIDQRARAALAADLAGRVRPRLAGLADGIGDEQVLEGIALIKSLR